MSERNWVGQGKGRNPGQPSLSLQGGAGMGSGRPGSQPNLEIGGGAGRGGGRAGSQPQNEDAVDFGDDTRQYNPVPDGASGDYRGASSMPSATTGGARDPRVADPEGNFIFALEIGGQEVGYFMECSGLKTVTEPYELQEGGMNHRVHKLPGQSRWENLVLRYGVTSDTTMLSWRNEILQDRFALRRNGSVVLKTLGGEEIRRYNFVEAWPVSWEGPSFASSGSELAIESLELAHNGIQIT